MKIVALNGLLGYGYSEIGLKNAFAQNPDVIGVDAGSTDPGPYYLGSGTSFTDAGAVKRDLALALPTAVKRKIPFIIGTAGGAGSEAHVAILLEILGEVVRENSLSFKTATVYADVEKDYVLDKFAEGKIKPMGKLELTRQAIEDSNPTWPARYSNAIPVFGAQVYGI